MMRFIVIENDPVWAAQYESAGVDTVMVDLETAGKLERQGHLDTVRSDHSLDDIPAVRASLKNSELLVRINPWNQSSPGEIESVIERGAMAIMLPMFRAKEEVAGFLSAVRGRVRTCLLLETPQALVRVTELLSLPYCDEIFIGLNDLSIGLGLDFLFEPLAGGLVDHLAKVFRASGVPFGFGGVGPHGGGDVPGSLIIREHARIGSTRVILSRTFRTMARQNAANLKGEIEQLRAEYSAAVRCPADVLQEESSRTVAKIWAVAERVRNRRLGEVKR